jgi:hypothetical protein
VWSIGQNSFTDFCFSCKGLVDGLTLKLSDVDLNLKATLYSEVKNNPRNPANALIRFQFMEILVRLAIDKFYKTGVVSRHSEAVERMFEEHCLAVMREFDSQHFRLESFLKEEVDDVFRGYLPIVKHLYNSNSQRNVLPGQKPFMCLAEFQDICTSAALINDRFTTREIDIAFNLAMMTQIDEVNHDRHFQMSFVEFLEALGRVAEMGAHPDPNTGESSEDKCLAVKLENIMPRLLGLCPQQLQANFEWPSPMRD